MALVAKCHPLVSRRMMLIEKALTSSHNYQFCKACIHPYDQSRRPGCQTLQDNFEVFQPFSAPVRDPNRPLFSVDVPKPPVWRSLVDMLQGQSGHVAPQKACHAHDMPRTHLAEIFPCYRKGKCTHCYVIKFLCHIFSRSDDC